MAGKPLAEAAEAFLLCEVLRIAAEEFVVDDDVGPGIVGSDLDVDHGVRDEAVRVVVMQGDEDEIGRMPGDGVALAVDRGGEPVAGVLQGEDGAGCDEDEAVVGEDGIRRWSGRKGGHGRISLVGGEGL